MTHKLYNRATAGVAWRINYIIEQLLVLHGA